MKKVIMCSILFFVSTAGAKVEVKAFVKPPAVSPRDTLTLTVDIKYESESDIRAPRLPPLNNFNLLGQNQSHQIQYINGKVSKKKQYHYILQPVKEGVFYIGSIGVTAGGRVYKTQRLKVTVSSSVLPRPAPPAGSLGGGLFKKMFPPSFFDKDDIMPFSQREVTERDLFVRLKTDKKTAYVGEMILAEWFLYLPDDLTVSVNSEVRKLPDMSGFWVEMLSQDTLPSVSQSGEEIRGKRYKTRQLAVSALFPLRAGELSVGALQVKHSVTQPASLFKPGFSPVKIFEQKSNTKKIKVLPLPTKGKSGLFTEAVGDFEVSVNVNKQVVSVGEPVVYKVNFKGKGHPRLIRLPNLPFGGAWEVYDTTESQNFSLSESTKTFEVILIPKTPGELKIPSFELSTFDPRLGVYKTHILPAFNVKVIGLPLSHIQPDQSTQYFDSAKKQKPWLAPPPQDKTAQQKNNVFVPRGREGESVLSRQNRDRFWFIVYGLLFFWLCVSVVRLVFSGRKRVSLQGQVKKGLKKVDRAVKHKQWRQAGIELNQLMYLFFSDITESKQTVVKSWDILLKSIHPSVRIKHEPRIRALVSRLERLSFARAEEGMTLRNAKSLYRLRAEFLSLTEQISREYESKS